MAEAGLVISHLFEKPWPGRRALVASCGRWSLRRLPPPVWLPTGSRASFHWGLGTVQSDFIPAFRRHGLEWSLAEYQMELFSFDLGPAARRYQGIAPLSRPLGEAEILQRSAKALAVVRKSYLGPLAVENYNYYPTGLYELVTEPEFIARFLAEFSLGLVLDLAHAAVTAHNRGLDFWDYLESLPLEKTVEIHLSRPWLPPLKRLWAVDAHAVPGRQQWLWLQRLLQSGRLPEDTPVFVEYYRDFGKLKKAQESLSLRLGGRSPELETEFLEEPVHG